MERFKIFKNKEGIYRVQIQDRIMGYRWLKDIDLMTACISSHVSKVLNCQSEDHAQETIAEFLAKEKMLREMWDRKNNPPAPPPEPSDTFEEIKKD